MVFLIELKLCQCVNVGLRSKSPARPRTPKVAINISHAANIFRIDETDLEIN